MQVTEAVRIAKELRPDLALDGPIQYDAAVDPVIAQQKVKSNSSVAGRATVCIFPDLNSGNATYKVCTRLLHCSVACTGPVHVLRWPPCGLNIGYVLCGPACLVRSAMH